MNSSSPDPAATLFPPHSAALSPHEDSRQRPSQPLRRSSPRLFRDFFNTMPDTASRRQATLPRPIPSFHDPIQNVNRALENANRALQDAQEAFHHARRLTTTTESEARILRTATEAPDQFGAHTLVNSPLLDSPTSSEGQFISRTIHPHDSAHHRPRRLNTLDEPIYGFAAALNASQDLSQYRANVHFYPPYHTANGRSARVHTHSGGHLSSTVEAEAISRQRENHSNWQRTQARNRERRRHQEQGQDQDTSSPSGLNLNHSSTMSRPTTSHSRTKQTSRRRSVPELPSDPSFEEVDLTAVDDPASLSAALAKQREDAILAQNPGTEAGRTPLTAYKCPVCMDTPTDATSTMCGHVFCHRCIVDTLNWSMEQRREDAPATRKVKGVCPVCRKVLDLKDTPGNGRSLVPLELKLLVKKRKREPEPSVGKGKGKSLFKAETISDDDDVGSVGRSGGRIRRHARGSTEEEIWRAFTNDNV